MTTTSPSRPARTLGVLVVALAVAGGGYAWFARRSANQTEKSTEPPAAAVGVVTIARGSFPVDIDSIGSVQALNTVIVRSRVDGQIEQVLFKEGQTVKAGDLLVKLDARPFQAALDQALAKKTQDEATLTNAKLDLQRYSQLAKNSFATEQQLNTQQATVASGQAQLAADQAAIENAQTQLSYTQIRAPLAGRIGFRQVDLGNIVHASDVQPILSIVQVDPISVNFTAPENRVYEIQQAASKRPLEVDVFTSDHKTSLASGKLTVVNNQVDASSGTVQIKATFDNAQMRLWPGQSVTVRLHVRTLDNVVLLPTQAIQRGQDGLYVWLVDASNVVTIRKIEVSMQADGRAVVQTGLAEGDRVVVNGQYRLFDKAPVTIESAPARPAAHEASAR
jgi:membrane fusion protein, multidrug efflux system